tara:strand:- start:162 stop:1100 length:939 start_codon:yes stop_codon:yes gene_type:complete
MGLANLVPGISGGTMLLATGIYDRFISAVSQVTTFRFRLPSIILLGVIVIGAGFAIITGADVLGTLVHEKRWIMFSLFIGLTLGGVPLLASMIKPFNSSAIVGCFMGILLMAMLAMFDLEGRAVESVEANWIMLMIAGAAGGATMVLPGVSGSYILLVLGQYLVILSAISALKSGVQGDGEMSEAIAILIPVGIGAIIGVVVVSNVMQWFLANARKVTLGVLMGFLLGAVLGLWPFHAPLETDVLMTEMGLTIENIEQLKPRDWPVAQFAPSSQQLLGAFGLIVLGFIISLGITMLGKEKKSTRSADAAELR